MHGFANYLKEGLAFAPVLSLDNSTDNYLLLMFSTGITSLDVLLLFSLSITFAFIDGF